MRRFGSNALAVGLAGIVVAGGWGPACSATKPTELVPGVFTQVEVPRNLAQIRIDVKSNGSTQFCRYYDVTNGTVILPATLGVVSKTSPLTTVTVEVRGYDSGGANGQDVLGCQSAPVDAPASQGGPGPRVLRRSIQTFVDQRTLFLPMPLSYSCFDTDCSQNSGGVTCKGAQCLDATISTAKLVDFEPSLIDGTQDCFHSGDCFSGESPAVLVDPTNCTYALPPDQLLSPPRGINARVFFQDVAWVQNTANQQYEPQFKGTSEQEILNEDDTEGFTLVGDQQFQLAPGLCNLAKSAATPPPPPPLGAPAYRAIVNVLVSSNCPTKLPLLPICRADRTGGAVLADGGTTTDIACNVPVPLVSAPSAIYLVMDNSAEMGGAFGTNGYVTAMNLSLAAPVFKRTYVAFKFLPHLVSDCTSPTTSFGMPDFDFDLASATQPKIAQKLLTWMAPAGAQDLYLEAAMRPDAAYGHVAQFARGLGEPLNVGAVMFFVNRTPIAGASADAGGGGGDPTLALDCPGADPLTTMQNAVRAAYNGGQPAADGTPSLFTYFVVLDNDQHMSPLPFFNNVQTVGGATTLDSTSMDANQVLVSFAQTMTSIGTCLYELPPGVDTSAALTYGFGTSVPPNSACSASQPNVDGWNIDSGRIRICGKSCSDLRSTVLAVTVGALQKAGPDAGTSAQVPDVPVSVTMQCAPVAH